MISSPPNSSKAPVNHANSGFWKKSDASVPMSGIRTTMMPGAMASQGPRTRANARVLALDSAVMVMGLSNRPASGRDSQMQYIRNMPNKANKNLTAAEHRFIEDVARLMVPWGVPQTAARL